jgi:death-on-curing family protein
LRVFVDSFFGNQVKLKGFVSVRKYCFYIPFTKRFKFCKLHNMCMARIYAKTLAKEAIIEINKKFEKGTMLNEGALDYVVYKVANIRGVDRKAATLLMELARRHAFTDGNKRTAFESMLAFLKINGKELDVGETSRFNVVVWAVKPKTNLDEIVTWIANHTRK